MKFLKLKLSMIAMLISAFAIAQNGFIRGTVIEDASGINLPGVMLMVEGTENVAFSDLDGKFSLEVPAGTHSVVVSYGIFETITITDIVVTAGKATVIDQIRMKEGTTNLDEVTITVNKVQNTEQALLTIKMKSPNMMDGISSANFKKIGDGDAGGAVKRVPGVSVVGGKYVYVRGLGDRYNKTILNGIDVPGLDPDRNSIQMDIFPTNIIDNIIIHKSFMAELPADFTGGVVDIALKDFPDQKEGSVSASIAYNPNYHFNSEYLTYEGGSTDFLGFDDGTREIPAITNIPFRSEAIGNAQKRERYIQVLEAFNPTLAVMQQNSLMDFSVGADYGNQFKVKKLTLGYNLALSYKNSTEFYQDAEFGRYGLSGDASETEMEARLVQKGDFGVNNVLVSGMAGFAIKTLKSKYRINLVHLQNGESKAGLFYVESSNQGAVFNAFQHNLEYSERALTNLLIDGKHSFQGTKYEKWELVWKVSPTLSSINDPDIRFTRYQDRGTNVNGETIYQIGTESGIPQRIWREMNERNLGGVIHLTKDFKFNDKDAKLKFGGASTYKQRDFIIRNFDIPVVGIELTGDPNELFEQQNLWGSDPSDINRGTRYEPQFLPVNPNQFDANNIYYAGYVSTELNVSKKLKTILGVRLESFTQRYTGRDQSGENRLNNDVVLDDLNVFPSINFVYNLSEKQNLRVAYSNTVARPSFKELSYAEIADPVTGRTFIGGLFKDEDNISGKVVWDGNLVSTSIHNFDLRWEIFQTDAQTISISSFYKRFLNPIEIVQFAKQAGAFQPRNVGDGQVIGGEIEVRQNLTRISKKLEKFSLTFNYTIVESRIEMSTTEFESRVDNARTGQEINRYRDMAGQAPYVINGGISYNGGEKKFWKGLEAGLYYNVQGQTLQFVGIVDRPDVYSNPFHSLNFNANKTFGKDDKMKVGFKVTNILNDKKESVFRSFEAEDQFFDLLNIGTTGSLSFSYKF